MSFTQKEKELLLDVPYVWNIVIQRLEEVWYDSCEKLTSISLDSLLELLASHLNASCYKNSPQARKSIQWVIECAENNI